MATSNLSFDIPAGEILAKYINVERMNQRLQDRIATLAQELNEEASAQLIKDGKKIQVNVQGQGDTITAKNILTESYLIEYLQDHDVPKSGGVNGIAHNVDGSTYISAVPLELQGQEIQEYMLPIMDIIEESNNLTGITFPEEAEVAKPKAIDEMKETAVPMIKSHIAENAQKEIGGGSA